MPGVLHSFLNNIPPLVFGPHHLLHSTLLREKYSILEYEILKIAKIGKLTIRTGIRTGTIF